MQRQNGVQVEATAASEKAGDDDDEMMRMTREEEQGPARLKLPSSKVWLWRWWKGGYGSMREVLTEAMVHGLGYQNTNGLEGDGKGMVDCL